MGEGESAFDVDPAQLLLFSCSVCVCGRPPPPSSSDGHAVPTAPPGPTHYY